MKHLAHAKSVAGAVICGTGVTAGIALYPLKGSLAAWIALGTIVLGFGIAAWPVGRPR